MATGNIEIKIEGAAAAQEADKVKKSLEQVDRTAKETQGSVGKFNQILEQTKKVASGVQKETNAIAKGFTTLSTQSKTTNASLSNLNQNIRLMVSQNDKMVATLQQAVAGIERLSTGTQKAGASTASASRKMGQFSNQLNVASQSALSLNRIMMAFGQGLSLAYAIKTLTEFDHTMAAVAAISRASGNELDSLREKAKELGSLTIYTSGEAAEAMRFLAQSGFQVNEILSASGGVLALAQAGNMGIAETAEIAAKALRGFRLEATQMDEVADIMAAAIMQSTMNLRELGDAFKYVAPIASSLGVDMREAAGFIGVLSDAGVDATMAGTSLRRIFSELTNPTIKAAKLIKNLGLTMSDLDVSSLGLVEVMRRLIASGIDVGTAFALFGDRGAVAFTTLSQKIDIVEEKIGNLQNVTGRAAEMQKVMASSLFAVWKELTSAIEFFIIESSEVSGVLTGIKMALQGMAVSLREVVNKAELLMPVLSTIGGLIALKLVSGIIKFGGLAVTHFARVAISANAAGVSMAVINRHIAGMGIAATASAAGVGALSSALSFFGGPIGITIAAIASAIVGVNLASAKSAEVLGKHTSVISALKSESLGASEAQKRLKEEVEGLTIAAISKKMGEEATNIGVITKEIDKQISTIQTRMAAYKDFGTGEYFNVPGEVIQANQELVDKLRALFAELQKTNDYNKFKQGLNEVSIAAKDLELDINDTIAAIDLQAQVYSASAMALQVYNDEIQRQQTLTKMQKEGRTGETKLSELLGMEQIGAITEELNKLDREIDILTNAPKNMQKVWTDVFKILGDSAIGLSIDFRTMSIAVDGSVVSAINLGKNLELIYQLINKLTIRQTLEDGQKANKGYGKSLQEVTKELDRLLMTDKEFQKMESQRQLAEFEKTLGKANPKVVQFRQELERAFAAGFSSVKEVAKTREEVDKMIKKTELGDLGFALFEIDEKYNSMKAMYSEGEAEITAITEAQQKAREDKTREYKDKELQTQLAFWNEYINLVGAYGGQGREAAIAKALESQTELYRIAKQSEVDIAKIMEMKKLEYSTKFQDGILRGMKKTVAAYSNEAALMESMWNTTVGAMEDTLADWIYSGELSFQSFVETVGKALAKLAVQMMVMKPLISGLTGTSFASFFGFADGGVFSRGSITPFASGGVVSSPTLFPMKSGTGLMGEKGKEAIMPLTTMPGGRLGVEAVGAGGSIMVQNTNVITFEGNAQQTADQAGGNEAFAELLTEKIYSGLEAFVNDNLVKQQRPGGILYQRG